MTKVYNVWAKKYRGVVFVGTEDWQKLKQNWLVLSKMTWEKLEHFHRLKNSDFILDCKMAELNQNKNWK